MQVQPISHQFKDTASNIYFSLSENMPPEGNNVVDLKLWEKTGTEFLTLVMKVHPHPGYPEKTLTTFKKVLGDNPFTGAPFINNDYDDKVNPYHITIGMCKGELKNSITPLFLRYVTSQNNSVTITHFGDYPLSKPVEFALCAQAIRTDSFPVKADLCDNSVQRIQDELNALSVVNSDQFVWSSENPIIPFNKFHPHISLFPGSVTSHLNPLKPKELDKGVKKTLEEMQNIIYAIWWAKKIAVSPLEKVDPLTKLTSKYALTKQPKEQQLSFLLGKLKDLGEIYRKQQESILGQKQEESAVSAAAGQG